MARTFRRQPLSMPTSSKDYPQAQFFAQTQFKGLCDKKNDVNVDQLTFSDVQNMYVDETGSLVSRPPLKIEDGESHIVEQWQFGQYGLRLYRLLCRIEQDDNGDQIFVNDVTDTSEYDVEQLYFVFLLRCVTHDTVAGDFDIGTIYDEYKWVMPVSLLGWDFVPKVTCAQIEDKIFVWFAGLDFVAFNTSGVLMSDGKNYPYFEDGMKYLYYPIHKLVINGIESDFETKNYLTETYRRRYQYSQFSAVNFEKLAGRELEVGVNSKMTQNSSKHLYDITVQEHQEKMMLYPYAPIGDNYHLDIVQTPRSIVMLRYSLVSHTIEVSFDGRFFRALPTLDDIVGNPLLTRDGLWIVAFTQKGLAKGKLANQESTDFVETNEFSWTVEPYLRNIYVDDFSGHLKSFDPSFMPTGYFETIDNFAYVVKGSLSEDGQDVFPQLYAEWLNGNNDVVWGHAPIVDTTSGGTKTCSMLPSDDIKVHFRYVAPTVDHKDLGAVVSIMTPSLRGFLLGSTTETTIARASVLACFFKVNPTIIGRTVQNGDFVFVKNYPEDDPAWNGFLYRLDATGRYLVEDDNTIHSDDIVLGTTFPIDISDNTDYYYDANRTYQPNDFVVRRYENDDNGEVYRCIKTCKGVEPTRNNTEYWERLLDPFDTGHVLTKFYKMYWTDKKTGNYYYAKLSWRFAWLHQVSNARYRIQRLSGSSDGIKPRDSIDFRHISGSISYNVAELKAAYGNPTIYQVPEDDDAFVVTGIKFPWDDLFPGGSVIAATKTPLTYSGDIFVKGVGNPATLARTKRIDTSVTITKKDESGVERRYHLQSYSSPCRQMDVNALSPVVEANRIVYDFVIGYGLYYDDKQKRNYYDCLVKFKYDYIKDALVTENQHPVRLIDARSKWFRIMSNTDVILTDKYLYYDDELIDIPKNGELATTIDDDKRNIASNDNLLLTLQTDKNMTPIIYDRNIHKLNYDSADTTYHNGTELASGIIQSGDLVSYTADAENADEYLTPGSLAYSSAGVAYGHWSNRFYIERFTVDENGNFIASPGGEIKQGELIRLRAYEGEIHIPAGDPGNPYDAPLIIYPWRYPNAPADWSVGDDWPTGWASYPKPIFAQVDGSFRYWTSGDLLPTGPVILYGVTNLLKRVRPINVDTAGVWLNVDGTLWTSCMSDDVTLELDEYVNLESKKVFDDTGNLTESFQLAELNTKVPESCAVMNEYYFSYVDDGKNLLQVTMARRDENKLFSEGRTDLLLYLPKRNEQQFAGRITALHPLSNTEMGVFTEEGIWYISTTVLDDGSVVYTKPVKSKIPTGLRLGSEVITALNGQAVIFPSSRGLVALAPQDFIATTEKTLTYLTDAIQDTYNKFYNNAVISTAFIPDEFTLSYDPHIHLDTYKYWVIMYKSFDREILALDTRDGTWWRWTTPYPIKSIISGSRLHLLLQMDFSPIDDYTITLPAKKPSLLGVSFLWTDQEVSTDYCDDVVPGVLNGFSEQIYVNEQVGYNRRVHYASPIIDWYFTSQRLHFGQINNYKAVKSINLNLNGSDTLTARMSTKAFRDLYHPEQSDVVQIKINDLRTFVKRFNLMHVIDFQYKIEADTDVDVRRQQPFKLNALSIKYEVKEGVR